MSWYYPTSSLSIVPRLTKRHRADRAVTGRAKRRDRKAESRKPNGMGTADERLQGAGRGDCESGIDL